MNEDELYDAAEREMDLCRAEITRITAERDQLRESTASLAAELHAEADRLAPPDWPADHDRITRARERHECADRIAQLTGSPQSAPPALAALTARWVDRAAVCDRDAGTARNGTSRAVLLAEAALFREFAAEVRQIAGAPSGQAEAIAAHMDELAANYPESVFPATSDTRDGISGTAMRHAYKTAARLIRERAGVTS